MKPALLALALCLPDLALADCVTPESLNKGVSFKRQDGHTGEIHASGTDFVIDYATNSKTAWTDRRRSRLGIYDLGWLWTPTDAYYVGGGPGGSFTYKFSKKTPVPKAGSQWTAQLSERKSQEVGLESGPEVRRTTYTVTYSFLPATTAELSGCTYTIQPVEAVFQNHTTDLTRRWIYFPDLGFGLETRVTDRKGDGSRKVGLIALTPKG